MGKPRTNKGTDKVPAEKIAIRFLIHIPAHGWQKFPVSRVLAIYGGKLPVIDLANQTVWVAIAHVIMAGKQVESLECLQVDSWHFRSDGRVDQKPILSRLAKRLSQASGSESDVSYSMEDTDIHAIRLALGLSTKTD